jgi:hypothetical protein
MEGKLLTFGKMVIAWEENQTSLTQMGINLRKKPLPKLLMLPLSVKLGQV